jgi:tripartite-type tricarboxylate transporter receptor subunit TctC
MPAAFTWTKAFAVSGERRVRELPGVPAIAETLPRFNFTNWFAMAVPPKTPTEIVAKLSQAIAEVLLHPACERPLRHDR